MKLVIRTDAKNVEYLFKKFRLYLEGTTTKMCRVEGTPDNIKAIKLVLDEMKYEYFDYTVTGEPLHQSPPKESEIISTTKSKRKRRDA